MEITTLDDQHAEFRIFAREEKMNAEILKVTLKEPINPELKLEVTDENGLLIYTKPLIPEPKHPNAVLTSKYPEIAVNKRFIFNAFITIKIKNSHNDVFLAEVHFV